MNSIQQSLFMYDHYNITGFTTLDIIDYNISPLSK